MRKFHHLMRLPRFTLWQHARWRKPSSVLCTSVCFGFKRQTYGHKSRCWQLMCCTRCLTSGTLTVYSTLAHRKCLYFCLKHSNMLYYSCDAYVWCSGSRWLHTLLTEGKMRRSSSSLKTQNQRVSQTSECKLINRQSKKEKRASKKHASSVFC